MKRQLSAYLCGSDSDENARLLENNMFGVLVRSRAVSASWQTPLGCENA